MGHRLYRPAGPRTVGTRPGCALLELGIRPRALAGELEKRAVEQPVCGLLRQARVEGLQHRILGPQSPDPASGRSGADTRELRPGGTVPASRRPARQTGAGPAVGRSQVRQSPGPAPAAGRKQGIHCRPQGMVRTPGCRRHDVDRGGTRRPCEAADHDRLRPCAGALHPRHPAPKSGLPERTSGNPQSKTRP